MLNLALHSFDDARHESEKRLHVRNLIEINLASLSDLLIIAINAVISKEFSECKSLVDDGFDALSGPI